MTPGQIVGMVLTLAAAIIGAAWKIGQSFGAVGSKVDSLIEEMRRSREESTEHRAELAALRSEVAELVVKLSVLEERVGG